MQRARRKQIARGGVDGPKTVRPNPILTPARITALALIVLIAFGASLRLEHISDVASRSPDEKMYTRSANEVLEKGPSILIPRKTVYLLLLAGAMKVTGLTDERAGAWLSFSASVAALGLVGILGATFLSRTAAIYAVTAMIPSVLDLAVARRCWQEALVECLALTIVWSACTITRDHKRVWPYAALFGVGTFAVLVKQLTAFLFIGTLAYVIVILVSRRAWGFAAAVVLLVLLSGAITAYAIYREFNGNMTRFWNDLILMPGTTSLWAVVNQSGPWPTFIWGLWALMPLTVVLSGFAAILCIAPSARVDKFSLFGDGERVLTRLFLMVTAVQLLGTLLMPGSQNYRYLAPIYGPIYLLGGLGFAALLNLAAQYLRAPARMVFATAAVATTLACAAANYTRFDHWFVRLDTVDLSVKQITLLADSAPGVVQGATLAVPIEGTRMKGNATAHE